MSCQNSPADQLPPFADTCVALQVLFSSSVMYGNFLTIAQRRAIAKEAQEHKDRSAAY